MLRPRVRVTLCSEACTTTHSAIAHKVATSSSTLTAFVYGLLALIRHVGAVALLTKCLKVANQLHQEATLHIAAPVIATWVRHAGYGGLHTVGQNACLTQSNLAALVPTPATPALGIQNLLRIYSLATHVGRLNGDGQLIRSGHPHTRATQDVVRGALEHSLHFCLHRTPYLKARVIQRLGIGLRSTYPSQPVQLAQDLSLIDYLCTQLNVHNHLQTARQRL